MRFLIPWLLAPALLFAQSNCELDFLKLSRGENYYRIADSRHQDLYVDGSIDDYGTLSLYLYTKTPTGDRSPLLRGKESFEAILQHFGPKVKRIQGNWTLSSSNKYGSDNLKTVNELTAKGVPLEEAVKQTWTGQQAAASGFSQTAKIFANGGPGNYSVVEVLFTKP